MSAIVNDGSESAPATPSRPARVWWIVVLGLVTPTVVSILIGIQLHSLMPLLAIPIVLTFGGASLALTRSLSLRSCIRCAALVSGVTLAIGAVACWSEDLTDRYAISLLLVLVGVPGALISIPFVIGLALGAIGTHWGTRRLHALLPLGALLVLIPGALLLLISSRYLSVASDDAMSRHFTAHRPPLEDLVQMKAQDRGIEWIQSNLNVPARPSDPVLGMERWSEYASLLREAGVSRVSQRGEAICFTYWSDYNAHRERGFAYSTAPLPNGFPAQCFFSYYDGMGAYQPLAPNWYLYTEEQTPRRSRLD